MRIASYVWNGRASYGIVAAAGVIDLGSRLGAKYPTLRDALAANAMKEVAGVAKGAKPDMSISQVELVPPIPNAEKIICAGRNYRGHALEAGSKLSEYPSLFLRLNSSLVGHNSPIVRSKLSSDYDFEGELAVIIGKPGRHIARRHAMKHVAGYACFNEACFRDFQFKHALTTGKNFAASGSFGPWMVTADQIPDPTQLVLSTRLNGVEVQHAKTDDLIFDIPTLIAYTSGFTPLVAGDVIVTGTPEGVGFARKPPLWMKAGDVVEVEITGLGLLRNEVVDEA